MLAVPYAAGLHRLTPKTYAYLQPPGSWGFSNCGLVADGDEAVLVDTQFTLPLTRRLVHAIDEALPRVAVTTVVNTHPNGDHTWGNELFSGATIIGSASTAHGMALEVPPDKLADLAAAQSDDSPLAAYMRQHFGHFDFSQITLTPPTHTFTGRMQLDVGDSRVQLIEVGPAHTDGDVIAYVPDEGVLFAGDILFIDDHPVMWSGPLENWVRACTGIIDTGAQTIVPGHGPVTGPSGVIVFRDYLEYVAEQARRRFDLGMPYWQAACDIPMPAGFAAWGHPERLVITIAAVYRQLGLVEATDLMTVLARTAEAFLRLRTVA